MSNLEQEIMTLIANDFTLKIESDPHKITVELAHHPVDTGYICMYVSHPVSPETLAWHLRSLRTHLNQDHELSRGISGIMD